MNKKDLKNFMVVKLRNGYKKIFLDNRFLNGVTYSIGEYDDDLKYHERTKNNDLDIVEVYRVIELSDDLESLLEDWNLELIWEREEEVDWTKVEFGTPVLVKNPHESKWKEGVFLEFNDEFTCPFMVYVKGYRYRNVLWEQCRLAGEL